MKKGIFVIIGTVILVMAALLILRYHGVSDTKSPAEKISEKDFTVAVGGGLRDLHGDDNGEVRRIDTPIRLKIIDIDRMIGIVTPSDILLTFLVSVSFIFVSFLAINFVRKWMNRPKVYSPYEKAIRRLGEIEPGRGGIEIPHKEAYFSVSHIVRIYIKDVFGFGINELTTREFLARLDSSAAITRQAAGALKDLILRCDLVKFSGIPVAADELKKDLEETRRLLDEINAALTPKEDKA